MRAFVRKYGLLLFGILFAVTLTMLFWPTLQKVFEGPSRNTAAANTDIAIRQASKLCLADMRETDTTKVQTSIGAQLRTLASSGTYTVDQVTKSVDLAVGEAALISERQQVRDCIRAELPRLLQAYGILKDKPGPLARPASVPGKIITFFEWGKSALTPEALTLINNAVSAYNRSGEVEIRVMAFGEDGEGEGDSPEHNIAEQRAQAVVDALVQRGIPLKRIEFSSTGGAGARPSVTVQSPAERETMHRAEIEFIPLVAPRL